MIKQSDLKIRLGIIFILTVVSILLIIPFDKGQRTVGIFKINLGLDLRGGMYILLRADTSSVPPNQVSDAIEGAVEKIRQRIDSFGVKETSIQIYGKETILIQVPGRVDKEIVDKLREVGKLEFKLVEDNVKKVEAAIKGYVHEGYELQNFKNTQILLFKNAVLSGSDLKESSIGFDQYGVPNVRLRFSSEGAKKFAKITEENVGKQLAILLDGKVVSAPQIKEPILSGEAEITGEFSLDEARALSSVLNSGALPIPLEVEEERSIGPLLGSDSIRKGIKASIFGAGLVFLFMFFYYLLSGIVANICLLLNFLYILAGLNIFKATLTLPGIAGLILALGMAVDANILIYERLREEIASKKPLIIALRNSFERTFLTILDANITTIIAAMFLFIFGTGPIRGFATTLILGILVSMFTAIFVGKTIFALLLNWRLKNVRMLKLFSSFNIDFMKLRYLYLLISLCVVSIGLYSFISKKDVVYGIDFRGGQILEYKLTPFPKIEEVRKILKEAGLANLIIQDFKDIKGGIIIKSKTDVSDKVEAVLKNNFKEVERLKIEKVGPVVGSLLKRKAFLAITFSLVGILFYVFIRFKHFDFALAGVIALLHDVLVALGFVSLFNFEIDLLIVTALLTIAGYSINDTIVIYDRIREATSKLKKTTLYEVLNYALNSTFSRTVFTSFTTLLVVFSLYFFGGESLKGFSFSLLVGFISGVYSSIYIASSLVLIFRKSQRV